MPSSLAWLRRTPLISALALLLAPQLALAAWPNDPGQTLPVVNLAGIQIPSGAVPDGSGGYFTTWMDNRSGNYDIYAQHFDAGGNALWAANGITVATGPSGQVNPVPALDGAGGIIVGWVDATAPYTIFAQRLNAAGVTQWGPAGVRVAVQTNNQGPTFSMCSDGAGGANFSWEYEFGSTDFDVYAQRLSPSGTRLWGAGGLAVCGNAQNQEMQVGVTDGAGGMWMLWRDNRAASYDIFAQHINAAGGAVFTLNGFNPETFVPGDIQGLVAVADGFGGVIGGFSIKPSSFSSIGLMHVYPDGNNWVTPVAPYVSADEQGPTLAVDPTGGAYVFWYDNRNDIRKDVFGSHVSNYGVVSPGWPADGLPVATGLDVYQDTPVAMGDGEGGAIVTWLEGNAWMRQILAKRFGPDGTMPSGWSSYGNPITIQPIQNQGVNLARTGNGGVFCTWAIPVGGEYDIVAQRIDRFGQIGVPEPKIASVKDVLNDQGGHVRVSWDKSPLDRAFSPVVHGYQVWRQLPQSAAMAALRSGAARLLEPGEITRPHDARRVIRAIVTATQTTYWEYAGGVAAQNFAGYSLSASTAGDSIAGSNPRTQFMVEAVDFFAAPGPIVPSEYWQSSPDSGYSVDNLPPALPASFTGSWSSAGAALHWNANIEPDLAGYRLYRGTSASFVPSPANRIATPYQTWFDDTGASPAYYRLSAFDIHGNEGPSALLMPTGTADVADDLPHEVNLAITSANPARQSVALRIELPVAAKLDVTVYDAAGRQVRELASGAFAAGRWPIAWRGETHAGGRAAAGVYFVRMRTEAGVWSRRVIMLP
jgi:hypothetical protein